MDSLTQIALGAAVGEAVLGKKVGNKAVLWGAVAATIPDLDVIPGSFMDAVAGLDFHRGLSHSILFCLILIWANDTGAYYVGSRYGVTKMAPALSPGKTWEGFFGGFLITFLAAWIGSGLLPLGGPRAALVLVGCISVVGPVGDLIESMIKRASTQKDSGALIPGHGGLLDRIDSLIICTPFLYYYCRSLFY